MKMQNEAQELIITKFNRHGHRITRKSLEKTVQWLKQKPSGSIDILLKKLSQLALQNSSIDENVQHAIEILSLKNKNLSSYDDLLDQTRKRCIYSISPYEQGNETFFSERPNPALFQFRPEEKMKNQLSQFKRITDSNKDLSKDCMLGVIFQNFSVLNTEGRQKIMMQNQVNQVELSFSPDFKLDCLLLSGCAYIAQGKQLGKDLSFRIDKIRLPAPPVQQKQCPLKLKFKQMCQNISSGKQSVGYQPHDFVKYDCVLTPSFEKYRPTLIFGNVTLNNKTIGRIKRLIDAYPSGVTSIFLLLSTEAQQQIDLTLWLKCKVFIVPHITSDGPRLLPKLPLLKYHIPGAKILTNPAKVSIEGKQIIIANYTLIRSIVTQNIISTQTPQLSQQEFVTKVADLVFSQGTIRTNFEHYWPQSQYFNIHSQSIVVVTDGVAAAAFEKKGKTGGLCNTGNFDRDGDFLCVMSWIKDAVQICGQMLD